MCYNNTKYFWWTSLRSLQLSDLMYVPMFRTTDRYWYMLFIDIHDVYHWSSLRLKRISSLFTCSICIHPYCLSIISWSIIYAKAVHFNGVLLNDCRWHTYLLPPYLAASSFCVLFRVSTCLSSPPRSPKSFSKTYMYMLHVDITLDVYAVVCTL